MQVPEATLRTETETGENSSEVRAAASFEPAPLPPAYVPLKSADDVRLEMSKVYRESKAGRMDIRKACQLVYILSEIRRAIETGIIEARVDALERERLVQLPTLPGAIAQQAGD